MDKMTALEILRGNGIQHSATEQTIWRMPAPLLDKIEFAIAYLKLNHGFTVITEVLPFTVAETEKHNQDMADAIALSFEREKRKVWRAMQERIKAQKADKPDSKTTYRVEMLTGTKELEKRCISCDAPIKGNVCIPCLKKMTPWFDWEGKRQPAPRVPVRFGPTGTIVAGFVGMIAGVIFAHLL